MSDSKETPTNLPKTIPMLEQDMKTIKEKITVIGNIASVARPYTPFDRMFFSDTVKLIADLFESFVNDTQYAIDYLGKSRREALFAATTDVRGFLESYAEVLTRLSELTNELEEARVLLNAYHSQYSHHA